MLFKNILVPWDGSKHSLHAFKIGLDMAKKYNSKITVLHCIDGGAYTGSWYVDSMYSKAIIKKQTKIAEEEIDKLAILAKNANISMSSHILVVDSVVKQIIAYAKSKKIDLVVMGSHGRTGWNKIILGSVANGVSQNIHCPMLIVK
ncbi:MAG: universal stress protein [Nitrosarchaeum sp.]|nr:universal stress protein [Nitrosarchaeum sp.]